jgi:F-type H+-transporting ATPase subunit gamma
MAETPREILRRIRGIKSTQQITKAMEMVAAVKLNKARAQAEHSRPYVTNLGMIMRTLCSSAEEIDHPMFLERELKKTLLLVITSDRGLCGNFNLNIVNKVADFLDEHAEQEVSVVAVGRKGYDAFSGIQYNIGSYYDVPWGDSIEPEVRRMNRYLTEAFETGTTDAVYLLYSHFENVLKHVPTLVQHLPIPNLTEDERKELTKWGVDFIFEPDFDEIAQHMIPRYLETQLYQCLIESLASEHAARMVSMRNANDNAQEVIEELTLSYNKARQATITKDLIDIIGGVEAMKGL